MARCKFLTLFALSLCLLSSFVEAYDSTNVAFGKTVIGSGHFHGNLTTITDGVFLPKSTDWRSEANTVWWTGYYNSGVSFQVDLGRTFNITGLIVQADDNDKYKLLYYDKNSLSWKLLWDIPMVSDSAGGGMQIRPNAYNNSTQYILPSPIETSLLKYVATSGDDAYAISEIQVFGSIPAPPPVYTPIPGTMLLFSPTLACLWLLRRVKSTST